MMEFVFLSAFLFVVGASIVVFVVFVEKQSPLVEGELTPPGLVLVLMGAVLFLFGFIPLMEVFK